ncbi:MAG: phosphatase PAP2 family protein [Peptococcaceae bacterium]|nr:phosphatase PAP2 family protein [Peptococcaceae bacterium]
MGFVCWLRQHLFKVTAMGIMAFVIISPYRAAYYAYLLLAVAFWGLDKDQLAIPWRKFLPLGLPLVLFPILLWQFFPPIWNQIVYWEFGVKPHLIDLDNLFRAIPGNNGAIFRMIKTPWLTAYMQWIYANGFTLPVLIPVFRSFFGRDSLKMVRYTLSAHVLQFILIFPFYLLFHCNEVWYVLGQPDGMARHLTAAQAAIDVMNCFPSMHTSVAFAMVLLAWREKDRVFRFVWTIFGISVIYSTLYLEIHWVLDVFGGLILAYVTVKLGDAIINQALAKGWFKKINAWPHPYSVQSK